VQRAAGLSERLAKMMRMQAIKDFLKQIIHYLWILHGYVGFRSKLGVPQVVTVLIAYYNPVRLKHVNHLIRNLLKCDFVERIVISNHNPQIKIDDHVKVSDSRLILFNQDTRRGCGYRWYIAEQFSPEYLIVLDDDVLLFPWQVKKLFAYLLANPEIPHGFAGMMQKADGKLDHFQRTSRSVDFICEMYAITGDMLRQYFHLKDQIETDDELANSIESTADFVIISRTGKLKPQIHYAGLLLRCPTFNQKGVAVHLEKSFLDDVHAVAHALDNLNLFIVH
jgi:hypothetical protein